MRFWDHDLGPAEPHLLALDLGDLADTVAAVARRGGDERRAADRGRRRGRGCRQRPTRRPCPRPRDLTPRPGRTADIAGAALTPDGAHAHRRDAHRRAAATADSRSSSIDTATGAQTALFDEAEVDFEAPAISHDGARIAYLRSRASSPAGPADVELWIAGHRRLRPAPHRRGMGPLGDRASRSMPMTHRLIATADSDGRGPIYRIPLDGVGARAADARRLHLHPRRGRSHVRATSSRCARSWVAPVAPGADRRATAP